MVARTLVVGAQGVLGSFIVHELKRHGWDVLRAGRRAETAADFRRIDLDDPSTWGTVLDEVPFIISTVPHCDLPLERYILEKGGILLSPACIPRRALNKLDDCLGRATGVVIPHAGLTPGLSNLLAVDLLRNISRVAHLAIGLTFKGLGASGEEGRRWVFGLFETAGTVPVTRIRLPSPMNVRRCVSTDLAAEGWLSNPIQPPSQRLEFCMIEKALNALLKGLNTVHLASLVSRIIVPDRLHRTPQPTIEQIYQWATVRTEDGGKHGWLISAHGDYRSTAVAVRIFAESALRLDAESRLPVGLARVQDILTVDDVKTRFSDSGISVSTWNGFSEVE